MHVHHIVLEAFELRRHEIVVAVIKQRHVAEIVDSAALATTHLPQIRNQAPTASVTDPTKFYGLGWNVTVDRFNSVHWQHSGAFSLGAATTVALLPNQELGVVVLTNGTPIGVPEALIDEILDTLFLGEPS